MQRLQTLLKQRKERGMVIASTQKIKHNKGVWLVPSATNPSKKYEVSFSLEGGRCTCEDYKERGIRCKHLFAVDIVITKKFNKDGTTTVTQTKRITYPQNWPAYDKASIQQKELFQKLLHDICASIQEPTYTFGRPSYPLRDMVFSSTLKVYSTFSLRRFSTDMKEAQAKGYVEKTPYYSTVARFMESEELTQIIKDLILTTALPLKAVESRFGIDATGFSPCRFSRWFVHKYGKDADMRMKWFKLSVVNGSATHIVTSCEVTSALVSDMMMLPSLTHETNENFNMKELSADKGYLSDANLMHLDRLGVQAYIPFKTNNKADSKTQSQIWNNAYNYFTFNQVQFLQHYHERSNTETVMHMVKSKFGDFLRSKSETACINEILLKVLCHNICVVIQEMFELGIKPEFWGAKMAVA